MGKRTCKVCGIEKEYNYLCLNGVGRSVYKDEFGKIWHSKTCAACFTQYVKSKSGKEALADIECSKCGKVFKKRNHHHSVCSVGCRKKIE